MRGHNIYSLQGRGRDLARCSPLCDLFRCFRRKLYVDDESVKRKSSLAFTRDEATAVLAQLPTTEVIYYDEINNNKK